MDDSTKNSMTPFQLAKKLRQFAKERGVSLRYVKKIEYGMSPFSFDLGLDRIRRIVFFTKEAQATGIIHELGHALFDSAIGPMRDEYDWFGWEWAVARCLDVEEQWRSGNSDYGVAEGIDFGQLSRVEQNKILKDQLLTARSLGYLDHLPEEFIFHLAFAQLTS